MPERKFEGRMSDTDALMWAVEKDPLLRSTITAIALLDQAPDHDRVLAKIDRGVRLIPRLRQRVVAPPFGVAPPEWIYDHNFDLNYHLRFVRAPGDGTLRDLLDLAAPMAMQGFDRARPLWEFTVVEGLADGKAAMIQKVHHAVTDGVGGIELALMLLDAERDPGSPTRRPFPTWRRPSGHRPAGCCATGCSTRSAARSASRGARPGRCRLPSATSRLPRAGPPTWSSRWRACSRRPTRRSARS